MVISRKKLMNIVLIGVFSLTLFVLTGCDKKEEPVASTETTSADQIEQQLCPVMEAPINKELYTEYKGKKVYFCCPGCKEKFKENPEKYLEKLPQFNNEK